MKFMLVMREVPDDPATELFVKFEASREEFEADDFVARYLDVAVSALRYGPVDGSRSLELTVPAKAPYWCYLCDRPKNDCACEVT